MTKFLQPHLLFITFLAVWLFVYSSTLLSMVGVWLNSETYKHCFMILPIVLFLIYEKREALIKVNLAFNGWFIILLILGQFVYLLAELSGINLVAQLAAYGTLLCLISAIYGWKLFRFLIFPLSYLILAVPMGEELVPLLQEITADISVFLVKFVGIPVYRDGLYIYIPNGTFEVAEACAGIRFLIAMIAIGVLYAHMFYQSTWRRAVFISLSIVIPIIANGFRAFGIVYIGHISEMKHAVGADHLVYGWFFFAFVLLLLMGIGKLWKEDLPELVISQNELKLETKYKIRFGLIFMLTLGIFLKPLYGYIIVGKFQASDLVKTFHTKIEASSNKELKSSFGAKFPTADKQYSTLIESNGISIELFSAEFIKDDQHQELINWGNKFYDIDELSLIGQKPIELVFENNPIHANLLLLTTIRGEKKKIIYWYQVGLTASSNQLDIKMAQLVNKLSGGSGGGYAIAVAYDAQHSEAEIKKAIELI